MKNITIHGFEISVATYKYVEQELFNYDTTKKELEILKEEILSGTGPGTETGIRGSGTSDTTANKAIRLMSSPTIIHLEHTAAAIEKTLKVLKKGHRDVFDLYYVQGLDAETITFEHFINRSALGRKRQDLILVTARNLGLVQ